MRATLHKSELLRGRNKFQEVFEKGISRNGRLLRCFILEQTLHPGLPPAHTVGFVVRRTISRAVDRNRIKRLLRESYRTNKFILQSARRGAAVSLSIVFMYAPQRSIPVGKLTYRDIEDELRKTLTSIAQQYTR